MIDVLIQTHNEELNLPHALASLKGWANKVFVVDSGSTDRTVEIGREFGAVVIVHPWEGYAAQKNWALDYLPFESPWILILDADEAVSPSLKDEIVQVVSRPVDRVKTAGYYINRVLIFLGQHIYHCGYFPSWNLRLFKRGMARYEDREVHEHMTVNGPTAYLKQLLIHEDRRGLEHFIAKHNRYSTLEAKSIYNSRASWPGIKRMFTDRVARTRFLKDRVVPRLPAPWLFRFFYMYVLRMGLLDRRAGWMLCSYIASYDLFVYSKYRELRRLRGQHHSRIGGLAIPEGQMLVAHRGNVRGTEATIKLPISPAIQSPPPAAPEKNVSVAAPSPIMPANSVRVARSAHPGKAPVSVLIPTLNESSNMRRCLDHLQWADEVVVVDSGSKDDTCAIAEAYGARVIQFKWDGKWPKKKNWALRNVDFRHDWVLIVDADEWITSDLASEIAQAVKSDQFVGYYINRRFIFMGQWIKHCGYYPSWNLRLIRRGFGEYEQLTEIGNTGSGDNEVHEHVVAAGEVGHLSTDMLHFAFPSITVFMEKHNRYSNWEAAVQFEKIEKTSAVIGSTDLSRRRKLKNLSRKLPFRPLLRFLYAYIWKAGFLDGKAGYIFCRLLGIYEYLSVAKYHELKRRAAGIVTDDSLSDVPAKDVSIPLPASIESPVTTDASA